MIAHARIVLSTVCLSLLGTTCGYAEEWTDLLADGKLEAWRGYNKENPPAEWKLADGVLSLSGAGGTLITRDKYADFELQFDWKISATGNSGVLYWVVEDKNPAYFTGPEYQVLDHEGLGLAAVADTAAGSLYGLYQPEVDAAKPAGEWNQGKIVVRRGAVEHWLNGQKLVQAQIGSDDWEARVAKTKFAKWPRFGKNPNGHIALQDHGNEVWYRKIRVRRLSE